MNTFLENIKNILFRFLSWLIESAGLEKIATVALIIIVPFLAFYNLRLSPHPWHDDSSVMLVSKTLVKDGVYAMRSSEGYQTHGPVQSVGPTVILPVALSYKVFGVGLTQGRAVVGIYLLLTLFVFYRLCKMLFSNSTALLTVFLLLGTPNGILYFGRQVLGEIPALGFYLAGWLVWLNGIKSNRSRSFLIAGLLVGAAMITKSSYVVTAGATVVALIILDLVYYKNNYYKSLISVGIVAVAMVAIWSGVQYIYFGSEVMQLNNAYLAKALSLTSGFKLSLLPDLLRLFIGGSSSAYFYFWWGVPGLLYVAFLSLNKKPENIVLAGLFIFTLLWLGHYFVTVPWSSYLVVPVAISAVFVAKLWIDLFNILWVPVSELELVWTQENHYKIGLSFVVLLLAPLIVFYSLLNELPAYVLNRDSAPEQVAYFLEGIVDDNSVIETYEQELGVISDLRFHYPDLAALLRANPEIDRPADTNLGADYFGQYLPDYLVIGAFARQFSTYDDTFVDNYGELVATIGSGYYEYQVYKVSYSEN